MADQDSRQQRGRDGLNELGDGVREALREKRSLGRTIAYGAATAVGFLVAYTVGAAVVTHLGQWLVLGGLGFVAYKVGKKPITKLVNGLRRLPDRLIDFFTEPADKDDHEVESPEHHVRAPEEGREQAVEVPGVAEEHPVAPAPAPAAESVTPSGLVIVGEGVRNPRRSEPAAEAPATEAAPEKAAEAAPARETGAAERQRQLLELLSQMSPAERKALLGAVESAPAAPAPKATPQAAEQRSGAELV